MPQVPQIMRLVQQMKTRSLFCQSYEESGPRYLCMFIATLFITARRWKPPKCPPVDKQTVISAYGSLNRKDEDLKREGNSAIWYNMGEP